MAPKSNFTGSYSSSFFLSKHGFFPVNERGHSSASGYVRWGIRGGEPIRKAKDVPSARSLGPAVPLALRYLEDSRGAEGIAASLQDWNHCVLIVLPSDCLGFCLFSASSTWYLFLVFKEVFPTPPRWWLVYKTPCLANVTIFHMIIVRYSCSDTWNIMTQGPSSLLNPGFWILIPNEMLGQMTQSKSSSL